MPNSAAEQIHITDYKISGFNVVVTMPDGQLKVLKDGLADIMLGNVVLIDKNGQPITKEAVLDHVNVKQNALDSAFLGDFIKNKSNEPSEETNAQPDDRAVAKEEILQSIIKELDHQLSEFKLNTSEATAKIDELSTQNQANLTTITNYLQQLSQAKAEADILRQQAMEKTAQLQSIKEQLPTQNLAEAFKSRLSEDADISNAKPYTITQPVPVSKTTPSSSASSPAEEDNRNRLESNEAAIDKTELEKLIADAARTKLEDNEAAIDKEELSRLKDLENHTILKENESAIDKNELKELKDNLKNISEEKGSLAAELDKANTDKAELDKVTSEIKDALSKLGASDFISPDFYIDAKLDPNSDLGNNLPTSLSDNITNITTPTFIGEASKGTKVRILISTGKEGDAALVSAEIDVNDVEGERYGVWSYSVPDSLKLTPGAYHFSATAYKSQEANIDGETKILTESSLPKTGTFVIDTELPSAEITTISDSQFNADNGWLTGTMTPTFSGATKANSDVALRITPKNEPSTEIFAGTATSSGTGNWAITVPDTVIPSSGDYHYWLTVTDSAGNTNNSDAALTVDSESLISTLQLTEASDTGTKGDWQTNVTTPTFEGVATKNSLPVSHVKVKITIDGKEYQGISGDDGRWSVAVTDPVTIVGNQSVSLVATDSLGKTFTTSHFININNTRPSVEASLTTETDTGSSHTDGITSSIAPVLHGTTTPGSKVTLTVYYNPLGSGYSTIDESSYKYTETFDTSTGSWSYNVPINTIYNELVAKYTSTPSSESFPFNVSGHNHDGVYNYTVSVKDSLDNEATSDLKSWAIDTVAPTIAVAVSSTDINSAPPAALIGDQFVLKTTKPTLTITSEIGSKVTITYPGADGTEGRPAASGFTVDNGSGHGVATIKLNAPISTYLDGVADSGTKALITVEDQAGNVSTQTVHLKFIPSTDISVPISVHLLEDDDSGTSNTDGITNNTQPRLTGTTVAGATVELTISPNGQPPYTIEVPKTSFNTAGTEWTIQLPHLLPNGVSVYTATASLDGNKSSVSGSLQIDTTAPELTELTLGGPKIGYVNNQWLSGKPVEWNQVGWDRETNTITFSTGTKLRQQGSATFIGALSESATINTHNIMVRHPITGRTREYSNDGITWTDANPSTGQPILKMAVGFNYRQNNLTDEAARKLQEEHIRPSGWSWGDLKTSDPMSIYGLGFEGFNGRWELNESTMTLTDLAGNSRTYNIHVQYNSVGPTVENIHIVNTADSDAPYNGDTRTNKGLGQNLYIKDLSGFAIAGTQVGAKEVVLVDVSDKTDDWLANANNRYNAATDKTATRYAGTLNSDGSWGVTYVTNARPGALTVIKVIPVLTNPVGHPQDNLSYLKINILQQDYTSTADLDPSTDTGILGDHITSNVQPTLTGAIANYNPAVTATISIAGQTATALTIDSSGVWSYALPNALAMNSTYNYTVTINDKHGNSSQVNSQFTIVGQISGALNPTETDDTGVIGDGITSNTRPALIGTVEAGSTAKVSYTDLSGKVQTISVSTDAEGKWQGRIAETLPEGVYAFTVSQLSSGNKETARQTFNFTIDTTPPTVTTELDKTFFNTLARDKNGLLFNNDPVLKGTVETTVNGSSHGEGNRPVTVTIPVTLNGKTENYVYQTVTSFDGSWQISLNSSSIINKTLPALPDGTYTYSVIGEDVAGNKASPVSGSFTLDTTPPELLEFGVKSNKLHDAEKGDGMTLYTTAFTGSQIFGKVNPGERIKIKFNGVGSTGKNTEAEVIGFTGYDVPDSMITINNATGVWSAQLPGLKPVTVKRYREQITPDGNVKLVPAGSTVNPDGAYYTAEIMAIDDAGNTRSVKVNYELGKLPPTTTSMVWTPDGELIGHSITATQQPVFTGNTRSGATVTLNLSSTVQLRPSTLSDLTDKQTFTTTADEKGNWRIEIDESRMLKAGYYYFSFTVTDENGLSDTIGYTGMGGKDTGTKYFLNVDLTPVGVEAKLDPENDSGINNDYITNITHQKILGSAQAFTSEINVYVSNTPFDKKKPGGTLISSTSSGETFEEPNLLRDKVTHKPFVPFGSENGWYMDIPGKDGAALADGTYYYRIEASNFIGRTENKYIQFTIDTTPPKLDVVSLAVESDTGIVGDRITAQTGPVLTGRSEPGATITVHVEDKTNVWREITTKVEDNGEWRATMPDFSAGKHRYWVEAVDIAGNKTVRGVVNGTETEPLTDDYYFIQNVYTGSDTPITSDLSLTSDTGLRDYITSNNTPTITGTAPLVLNTVNGKTSEVFLDIVVNGITQTYSGFNDGRGNYSISITKPLPNGFYKYKVYTADAAGNKSTIYDSPDNLSVRGSDGKVSKYTFQVQRNTSYEDLGLKDTSAFNITAATAVGLQGKIRLSGSQDKAENYTVSVTVTDINADGRPRTLTANTAIESDGTWSTTGGLISMATRGIHTYTVTINDKKTGTNTTYSNTFTVLAETSTTTTTNETLAEQLGNLPKFAGTAPSKTKLIKLNIFDSRGNPTGTEKEIAVDSTTGKWNYTWSKEDQELLDGEYSYTLRTVNVANQTSANFISGSLEIYTTPPVLNYVEQDTSVAQDGSITMNPGVLFHGYVDVSKGKYAKNLPSTTNELPTDTVTVAFKDFTINPSVNKTTGRWEITKADYEKQMESSGGKTEDNTAYTVTLKDRFGNTTTDSGDLAPNNDNNGESSRPLFMGEADPGATITVVVKNTTSSVSDTARTTAGDDGHWEVSWSKDLPAGTYDYSLNVVSTGGANYNTGNLGSITIAAAIPKPVDTVNAADLLSSADTSPADTLLSPVTSAGADALSRAAVEFTDTAAIHHHDERIAA